MAFEKKTLDRAQELLDQAIPEVTVCVGRAAEWQAERRVAVAIIEWFREGGMMTKLPKMVHNKAARLMDIMVSADVAYADAYAVYYMLTK